MNDALRKVRTLAVTGGTGFVGQHLIRIARAEGYEVRALTRGARTDDEGIRWVEGALDRPDSLRELAQGADAVIHIAGLISGLMTAVTWPPITLAQVAPFLAAPMPQSCQVAGALAQHTGPTPS